MYTKTSRLKGKTMMACWLFIPLCIAIFSFLKGAHLVFVIMQKAQHPVSAAPTPPNRQLPGERVWGLLAASSPGAWSLGGSQCRWWGEEDGDLESTRRGAMWKKSSWLSGVPLTSFLEEKLPQLHAASGAPRPQEALCTDQADVESHVPGRVWNSWPGCFTVTRKTNINNRDGGK